MVYSEDGMNIKNFDVLYDTSTKRVDYDNFRISLVLGIEMMTLDYFTSNILTRKVLKRHFSTKKMNFYEKYQLLDNIRDVYAYVKSKTTYNKKNNTYRFNDRGYDFEFKKLSSLKNMPYKRELNKIDRLFKCHSKSIELLYEFDNAKLVTGYLESTSCDILHTVLEIDDKYIGDYTKNLLMKKEDYEKLIKFRKIQSITRDDYLKDTRVLFNLFHDMWNKTYLSFRDEIMNDLNKNKLVLKPKN